MANVLFKKGELAGLKNAPIQEGTIYITTDERAMYLDISATLRIRLGDFIEVADINSLPTSGANVSALYYATKENVLAKWSGSAWVQINPDNWFELKSFTQTLSSSTEGNTTTIQVLSEIELMNEAGQSDGKNGAILSSLLKFKDGGSVTISTEATVIEGESVVDTIKISATDQSVSDVTHHYTPDGDGTLATAEEDKTTGNTFITGVKTDAAGHVIKVTRKDAVIDKVSNAQLKSDDATKKDTETSAVKLHFSIDHGTANAATDDIRISGAGATTVTHSSDKETIQISSTDRSVTEAQYHYTPTAVTGSKISVASGKIISEILRDNKGHVTGVDTIDENKVSSVEMISSAVKNASNQDIANNVKITTKVANARGGSPLGDIIIKGTGDTKITSTDDGTSVTIETHDTQVTSAANHYKALLAKDNKTPIKPGTYNASDYDVGETAAKASTPVITGVTIDAAGHVTGVTATNIADTHAGMKDAIFAAQTSGWQLSVSNSDNSTAVGTFDPVIKYGKTESVTGTNTLHATSGVFNLDTYTTGQIDDKITTAIQATGAMVLKGELTSTKGLPTDKVAAGDTYIVTTDGLTVAGNVCEVGDLFVAKADIATGSTNANWYYVPSGNDKHIIIGKDETETVGAVLVDGNQAASARYGSINFNSVATKSPSLIKATKTESAGTLGAKDIEFTFSMEWGSF